MRNVALRLSLVVAALAAGTAGCRGSARHDIAAPQPLRVATTTTEPPPTTTSTPPSGIPPATPIALAAYATQPKVTVYDAPGSTTVKTVMGNPTIENMQLAMFVGERQGDWLHARLPMRPNGSAGWIRASDVHLEPMKTRIVVDLSERRLQVLDLANTVLFQTAVAVGKPATPTTVGRFFVDVWLPNPGRPYGPFMLSIGGFSEVLKSFGGGRGQLAIHGWPDPSVMGRNVSNGCVRMRNQDVTRVAELAPLGTPIEIIE